MALEKRICPMCKKEQWMFDYYEICIHCAEKQIEEKRWDEICKDEIADGVTEFNEDVVRCPWCGERQCDDTVLYGVPSYLQCQSCHQKFTVKVETHYTYDTTRGWEEE